MAKQTFTTGQVLTAQQVSDLQKNGYNQTVNQKTASYVLVATDVGTRIEMNSTSATTITINTGLFAAGDTVFLSNINSGSCVVTAGTATVSKFSTASLTLSQYQGAYLYFVSTGVAILYSDSAGSAFPVTTKGDLFGYDTAAARIPIGANDTVLTADSTQSLGLKWAAASSGGMTSIASGSLSGSSVTISTIAGTYKNLQLLLRNPYGAPNYGSFKLHFNSDTGSNYSGGGTTNNQGTWTVPTLLTSVSTGTGTYVSLATAVFNFYDYAGTSSRKTYNMFYGAQGGSIGSTYYSSILNTYTYNSNSAITSITLTPENSPWTGGTYILYGVS